MKDKMATLQEFSDGLVAAVAGAAPMIVAIDGRQWTPASGLVWNIDGVIVTASHVIDREEQIKVGLPDGTVVDAKLVGRDTATDLAVVRVASQALLGGNLITHGALAVKSDPGASLKVGQSILAVARPGQDIQASFGIISAVTGEWRTPSGGQVEYLLQPDLTLYPGFSGGALVTANGQVVGLNTSGLLRNLTVALPLVTLERVVETLLAHGHMRQGYLGIGSQPVRLPENLAVHLGQETGLLISSVEPSSPAGGGGLLLGDILVALGGQPIRLMDDLWAFLNGEVIGREVTAKVVRGGSEIDLKITPGEKK
jgi:S1-C subfamily serine protease